MEIYLNSEDRHWKPCWIKNIAMLSKQTGSKIDQERASWFLIYYNIIRYSYFRLVKTEHDSFPCLMILFEHILDHQRSFNMMKCTQQKPVWPTQKWHAELLSRCPWGNRTAQRFDNPTKVVLVLWFAYLLSNDVKHCFYFHVEFQVGPRCWFQTLFIAYGRLFFWVSCASNLPRKL